MGLFDFFTGKKETTPNNGVEFGRFLECNKPYVFTKIWKESAELFKEKKYVESFERFLAYLENPPHSNVSHKKEFDKIQFEIVHGSAVIKGTFDDSGLYATTEIGRFEGVATALFRDLLIKNFMMNYNSFCIDGKTVLIKHHSPQSECSPMKLYFALKEMAMKADIHSQALFDDFNMLEESFGRAPKDIPETELNVKVKYLKKWINETLSELSSMTPDKDANIMSHYLLSLSYRVDFLLSPRAKVWKLNDMAVAIYSDKVMTMSEKIRKMISYLRDILDLSDEVLKKSFFKTVDTFAIVNASNHNDLVQFFLKEFNSAKYYSERRLENHTQAVYEQSLGYVLYFQGVFPAVRELLTLYYKIFYPEFFEELGIKCSYYDPALNKFSKWTIESQIGKIISRNRKTYPKLIYYFQNLRYENKNSFAFTFLNEITYLNFWTKAQ